MLSTLRRVLIDYSSHEWTLFSYILFLKLRTHYAVEIHCGISCIEHFRRDLKSGWLIRSMHASGASFSLLLLFMRILIFWEGGRNMVLICSSLNYGPGVWRNYFLRFNDGKQPRINMMAQPLGHVSELIFSTTGGIKRRTIRAWKGPDKIILEPSSPPLCVSTLVGTTEKRQLWVRRMSSWNSTLQPAWYVRHALRALVVLYSIGNVVLWIKSTIWLFILSSTSFMVGRSRVLCLFLVKDMGRSVTPQGTARVDMTN